MWRKVYKIVYYTRCIRRIVVLVHWNTPRCARRIPKKLVRQNTVLYNLYNNIVLYILKQL